MDGWKHGWRLRWHGRRCMWPGWLHQRWAANEKTGCLSETRGCRTQSLHNHRSSVHPQTRQSRARNWQHGSGPGRGRTKVNGRRRHCTILRHTVSNEYPLCPGPGPGPGAAVEKPGLCRACCCYSSLLFASIVFCLAVFPTNYPPLPFETIRAKEWSRAEQMATAPHRANSSAVHMHGRAGGWLLPSYG